MVGRVEVVCGGLVELEFARAAYDSFDTGVTPEVADGPVSSSGGRGRMMVRQALFCGFSAMSSWDIASKMALYDKHDR
jgi:hypothetical protein